MCVCVCVCLCFHASQIIMPIMGNIATMAGSDSLPLALPVSLVRLGLEVGVLAVLVTEQCRVTQAIVLDAMISSCGGPKLPMNVTVVNTNKKISIRLLQ